METAQAFQWINTMMQADTQLVAASTGGIWQGRADIGVTGPYALFAQQSAPDVLTMNGVRLFTRITMQIVAIGPTSNYAALVTIADRIDALFKDVRNTALSQGGVLSCYRQQPLAIEDPLVNGQAWSRLGGLYVISLQGS